jgi:allophanate hydrolase subunit 2
MGARLSGPELVRRDSGEMLSDGTVPGALQVPPSGQPILLLADCQTTGGYPKIATVISADIPAAGRLMAGSRVRFAWVDVEEAVDALGEAERLFHRRVGMIATVREGTRFSC